ncbi:hypothetical protein CPB86DRAFT_195032 [Serendipita vermifera]|nr:hypothetical protein CPB86DRAFT_195032 [Serendipita vermifera]
MEDEEPTYQPRFRPSNPEPPRFRLGVPAVVSLQAWAYELRHRRRFHVPSSPLHKGPITNKPLAQLPALAPRYRRNNKPSMSELVSDEDDNSRFGLDQSLSDTAPTEVHSLFSMKCYSESHDDQSAESTSDHDTGYLTSGPVGALATPSVYYTPHETSTIPPPASEEFALPASNPRADNEQAGPSAIRGRHNCGPQGVISQYKTYFDTVRKSRVQEKIAKGKKREQRAEKYLEQYK